MSDAGTRLLFKFRLGTHRLNEELGRHRGSVEMNVRVLVMCCGNVRHMVAFVLQLKASLGGSYSRFEARSS